VEAFDSYGMYYIHGALCNWWAMNNMKNKALIYAWQIVLPGGPQANKWYRLMINTAGKKISFFIDDELQFETEDSLHPSGGVGLYAYNAIVEFDNVVITGDEIPEAGPSGFAVEPGLNQPQPGNAKEVTVG